MSMRSLSIVQATDADVLVKVGEGVYGGLAFLGIAPGVAKVYDSASVAGVAATKLIGTAGVAVANDGDHDEPSTPIKFTDGLVVVITGAGNLAQIRYR